jgi:hypothetical protein
LFPCRQPISRPPLRFAELGYESHQAKALR